MSKKIPKKCPKNAHKLPNLRAIFLLISKTIRTVDRHCDRGLAGYSKFEVTSVRAPCAVRGHRVHTNRHGLKVAATREKFTCIVIC